MKLRTDSSPRISRAQTADVTERKASGKSCFNLASFRRRFFKRATNPFAQDNPTVGFTLVEMMIATALGTLLIASVVALGMFTSKSFNIIGNYVDLDAQSLNTADVLSRQIRDATALVRYSTNNPSYLELTNSIKGQLTDIVYNKNTAQLVTVLISGGVPVRVETNLTQCDNWTFSLYNRAPNITSTNVTFNPTTNAAMCKMINMTWNCSRTVLGSKLTTEIVQTAEIVMRNQITY